MSKRFDYCTIIGRDPQLYQSHVDNVLTNAGLSRDLWNFHTIVYRNSKIDEITTQAIIDICDVNDTFVDSADWNSWTTRDARDSKVAVIEIEDVAQVTVISEVFSVIR